MLTNFAVENFYHLPTASNMFGSLFNSSGKDPAKSKRTSSFG